MGGKGAQTGQTVWLLFSGHLLIGQILVGQILRVTVGQILGLGPFSGGQRSGKEKDGQIGQFFSGQIWGLGSEKLEEMFCCKLIVWLNY